MFSDDDFANKSLMKAPPSEKPPPPPPEESSNAGGPGKKGNAGGGGEGGDGDDDEIDQQERQIIASLEMEEREHNRYIMEQKMKRLPSNLSSNSSATINTGKRHLQISNKKESIPSIKASDWLPGMMTNDNTGFPSTTHRNSEQSTPLKRLKCYLQQNRLR